MFRIRHSGQVKVNLIKLSQNDFLLEQIRNENSTERILEMNLFTKYSKMNLLLAIRL